MTETWVLFGVWLSSAVVALVLMDFWLLTTGGTEHTFSAVLLAAAQRRPIVAAVVGLVMGVLLGHLFWPQ